MPSIGQVNGSNVMPAQGFFVYYPMPIFNVNGGLVNVQAQPDVVGQRMF